MRTWRVAFSIGVVMAATTVLCGCVEQRHVERSAPPRPHHSTVNTSTFPLYRASTVVEVVPIDLGPMVVAMRRNQTVDRVPARYQGSEVVASTDASIGELETWLRKLEASPPDGLRGSRHDRTSANDFWALRSGAAGGASFDTADGERVVLVFAADPRLLRAKLGSVLDLIDNYQAVPDFMRGPIDSEMKKQVGYSVSEMLDPASPVGVAFAALRTLEPRNKRVLVLIDEHKAH